MSTLRRYRIGVIGAGNVGATLAQRLADLNLGDVLLTDVVEGIPQGKTLDLRHAANAQGLDASLEGFNESQALRQCDVVVMTAGLPRKPGMTREDLLRKNADIVRSSISAVREYSPEAVLVMVTNPLDVMTYLAYKVSGFPKQRVVGMAGILDASRFAYYLSQKLSVSVQDIRAMVLGTHGDTMVPLPRFSSISGIPVPAFFSNNKEELEKIVQQTRDAGTEVVNYLKQGSAYYAPSASIAVMVRSILKDEKRILPCSAILSGEYGLTNLSMGVPVKLGKNGVEQIVELPLNEEEKTVFQRAAETIRSGIQTLGL